ncbi:NAD(P)-binding protein, partial [Saccharata proteae CBS 121410]
SSNVCGVQAFIISSSRGVQAFIIISSRGVPAFIISSSRGARAFIISSSLSTLNGALNGFARRQWCWREQGEKWDFSGPRAGGEVVVVTGGCGGFGRGIVKGLMGRCRVVVLDVQELPEEFEGRAGLYYYRCDLTSPASIAETAAAIRRDAGDPTVLINNAGLVSKLPILETSREDLERLFRVNLFSHWALIQEFLPAMLEKRKGHVVSVASMASYLSGPCMGDYSATKAGVLALHEALTAELRSLYTPNGTCIRTTIVHPMWAATPMLRDWQPMLEARGTPILDPSEIYDRIVAQVLSGKSAQIYVPAEVGRYSGLRGWPTWLQEWIR